MAIVNGPDHEERAFISTKEMCAMCRTPPTAYPYLLWADSAGFFVLCGECCHSIKHGLIADLIHIGAILDIRDCGYRDVTLDRRITGENRCKSRSTATTTRTPSTT
jgi:hypothetical protein